MGSRLHYKFRFRNFNVNYSHTWDFLQKNIQFQNKTFDSFRLGVKIMFEFLAKESSPIFAQRIIRSYRALQLHSKLWSNHVAGLGKTKNSKRWMLGLVMYSLCHPNNVPVIDTEELMAHANDLDYIHDLTVATVVCEDCKDRLVINKKIPNIKYCHCRAAEQVYGKKASGYPWLPFLETPDLIIWRQPHHDYEGLFAYKVYGYYDDISPEDFLSTQLDLEYRQKWDGSVQQLKVVGRDHESSTEIVYWETKWPKFFANRDYCFLRRHVVDEETNIAVIMNKAVTHPSCPENKGVVRVREYTSIMLIKAVKGMNDKGVEFGLTYFDNPGLPISTWLANWLAYSAIPDYLNKVRSAAREKGADNQKTSLKSKESHPASRNEYDVRKSRGAGNGPGGANFKRTSPESPTENLNQKRGYVSDTQSENTIEIMNENRNKSWVHDKGEVKQSTPHFHSTETNSHSVNSNLSGNVGNASTSSEKGEILSQFFKENFLTTPASLNDG